MPTLTTLQLLYQLLQCFDSLWLAFGEDLAITPGFMKLMVFDRGLTLVSCLGFRDVGYCETQQVEPTINLVTDLRFGWQFVIRLHSIIT
ncbi:MAG: hypothetical protein CWE10_08960 [Symbiobacterium thermophilum]|uniref:Uncharacterized protein n=1 Tax=Symbiobacterium thermophilum TaxID=2734 RepID=A0A953LGJ5_SYMTR|nr:hypothetical protein [Symbiobacterium thermophilum]